MEVSDGVKKKSQSDFPASNPCISLSLPMKRKEKNDLSASNSAFRAGVRKTKPSLS